MAIFLVFLGLAGVVGIYLHVLDARTGLSAATLRELRDLPVTSIADAGAGRVKIEGGARATRTEPAITGNVPCLFLERLHVSSDGSTRRYRTETFAFPFELTDASGSIAIDPSAASIDAETLTADSGNLRERAIRDGDRVVVIGHVVDGRFEPTLVSWRTDPAFVKVPLPALLIGSTVAAVLGFGASAYAWVTDPDTHELLLGGLLIGGIAGAVEVVRSVVGRLGSARIKRA